MMVLDAEQEDVYIRMATENPGILCSEAPQEILKESSYAGDEPTLFLMAYFMAGHTQWLARTYNLPAAAFEKERVGRAALLLWIRACELYTSLIFNRPDPSWDLPFFSDEGLY